MATKDTKEPGTAVVTWKERMAEVTKRAAEMEAPKGGYLSFKGGRLSYDETNIPGDKINVIILDFALENSWFKDKYDAKNPSPPVCYAIGRDEDELAPHEESEDAKSDKCATCQYNEWGSNREGGRGKDCKNTRRIAMIASDVLRQPDPVTAIKKANVVQCKLPVTSIKLFSKAINQVVRVLGVPPFGVEMELSVTPSDNMFSVNWKVIDQVRGDDILQALYEKHTTVEKLLFAAYPKKDDEAPAANKSGKY